MMQHLLLRAARLLETKGQEDQGQDRWSLLSSFLADERNVHMGL